MAKFLVLLMSLLLITTAEPRFNMWPKTERKAETSTSQVIECTGSHGHGESEQFWHDEDPYSRTGATINPDHIQLPLWQDFNDLQNMKNKLENLVTEKINAWNEPEQRSRHRMGSISDALQYIKDQILGSYAEALSSLYLVRIGKQPVEESIKRFISNHSVDDSLPRLLADAIMNQLKQSMLNLDDYLRHGLLTNEGLLLEWWNYFFKSWDFLIKHQFISPSKIAEFFDDSQLTTHLNIYRSKFAEQHDKKFADPIPYHLTEHWFWKLSHGSLKGLKKQTENTLNAFFMQRQRYWTDVPDMKINHVSLRTISVYHWFEDNYLLGPQERISLAEVNIGSSKIKETIRIIATPNNDLLNPKTTAQVERRAIVYFCSTLEYLTDHVEPPSLDQVVNMQRSEQQFDMRHKLILISAEMDFLDSNLQEYAKLIQSEPDKSLKLKEEFDEDYKKLTKCLSDYSQEYERVKNKYTKLNSDFKSTVQEVINYFKKVQSDASQKL